MQLRASADELDIGRLHHAPELVRLIADERCRPAEQERVARVTASTRLVPRAAPHRCGWCRAHVLKTTKSDHVLPYWLTAATRVAMVTPLPRLRSIASS